MTTIPSQPAIAATGLRKSFGDTLALDGIDLEVAEGTIFALLGPNGAGKTTAVNILSSLIGPDAGEVRVAGHDLARAPDAVRSAIGVTGQFSAVDKLLTGEENLLLMADLYHLDRRGGRRLLVQRITELGWPPAQAAEALGVSRATAYKWLGRYRTQGQAGLADHSSRPHRCPHALSVRQVRRVLVARRRHRQGPHRLAWRLHMPRSTIYGVLRRHGMSRLADTDRASGVVVRYQREHPGELVHLDVKKLGRIPDGGGHRAHGRAAATPRGRGIGYDYLHSAVDDRSRVAFSQLLSDESAMTAAGFLVEAAAFFADHGVRIERVLTDNAKAYTESIVFAETAAALGITLKRTRRYRPQTNGKVERFNKTLLQEWAYARLYRSNDERRRAFRRWLRTYNHRRPHTSLDGLTPMAVLVNNVHGKHT